MPNIVKHTEFKKVVDALWNKVKGTFVTEVNYDANSSILKYVKNGLETEITNIITEWQDLEHVEQYQFTNLMEYNKKVTAYHYGGNGDAYVENTDWSTYFLDVKAGEQYTIMRKVDDSNRFIFTDSVGGTKIDAITVNTVHQSNGFSIRSLTVPSRAGITKLAIQFRHNDNGLQDIMVVSGVHTTVGGFIPYADGNLIQIGTEVSHKFDNTGSNLGSTTISSAIKELDSKVAITVKSVNEQLPNDVGNVTINASQIDTTGGKSVENELSELSMLKVDKYKDSFIVDLTVDDIKLSNAPIKSFIPTGAYGVANERTLAGNRDTSVQQDIKVSKILVGVDGYLDGETVTGVEVYAVNKANNTIVERIVYEGIGIARKPKGYENHDIIYVDVEVNKSFPVEVYFIEIGRAHV